MEDSHESQNSFGNSKLTKSMMMNRRHRCDCVAAEKPESLSLPSQFSRFPRWLVTSQNYLLFGKCQLLYSVHHPYSWRHFDKDGMKSKKPDKFYEMNSMNAASVHKNHVCRFSDEKPINILLHSTHIGRCEPKIFFLFFFLPSRFRFASFSWRAMCRTHARPHI